MKVCFIEIKVYLQYKLKIYVFICYTLYVFICSCIILCLDLFTNGSDILTAKEVVCRKNKSLKRVLYKIPDGMEFKERTGVDLSDMLTVVVEISVCNHIKVIFISYKYL